MYIDATKIMERLHRDYTVLSCHKGYEVLGVFVYGSQNYGLSTPTSDIDTKAIVIPSAKDMIFGKTEIKTTLEWEDGICDVHDIKSMHDAFKKQNINFLEILFTEYRLLNPEYEDIYYIMFESKEDIAHLNKYKALMANYGTISNKLNKLMRAVPSNLDVVAKYGYDNKALADVFRIEEFIQRYESGVPFAKCLISANLDELYNIKTNPQYYCEEVVKDIQEEYKIKLAAGRERCDRDYDPDDIDHSVVELIDTITERCCKRYLLRQMEKESTWGD